MVTGHALVGVASRLPSGRLAACCRAIRCDWSRCPDPIGGTDDAATATLPTLVVAIADVGPVDDTDGSQAIDLLVPLDNVNAVAGLGVRNRLAVVLVNGG